MNEAIQIIPRLKHGTYMRGDHLYRRLYKNLCFFEIIIFYCMSLFLKSTIQFL